MKVILILYLLLSLSVIAQPENPGPLKAGWTNLTINRDGRTLNSILYYPSYVEGSGAQIDTTNGPYPIIAFGHGFAMQNSYYISLFKHLASYGYVVIAPQFPDVNHLQLAFDLLFCVRHLKNQNTNPTSIFFRMIDTTKVGLSGHSMGGGASLLAAANDSSIAVVAPLAAAETNPSVISVMNQIKSVVYLITAQNDGITPPQNHQIPMFNNALPIRGLPIIKGANHTKFMDTRIWDWTDPRGYLTPAEQLRLTRRYLTSVYNLFLKEDTSYFKFTFGSLIQNDTSIIFQRELKPLHPKKFSLLSPQNASFLNQTLINFQWNKTYSLNLNDTIRYKLIISRDSLFNNIYFVKDSIINPTYQHNFNEDGKYYWKVIAYSSDLTFTESNIFSFTILIAKNNDENSFPTNFRLHQNYPNPFGKAIHSDNTTTISFTLSEDGLTTLKIYDLLGREIQTVVNE
ncbi:MAG: hypothetical protein NZM09_04800 [Ignavibacterium sp.]|nr:hypothetical protein [Ignavibacterium sp.]MDW8374995.1 hypothetical protein [Ignavibacteriales bacterium]